jgi:hypothetical protein
MKIKIKSELWEDVPHIVYSTKGYGGGEFLRGDRVWVVRRQDDFLLYNKRTGVEVPLDQVLGCTFIKDDDWIEYKISELKNEIRRLKAQIEILEAVE